MVKMASAPALPRGSARDESVPGTEIALGGGTRDTVIDGWRAVAVTLVLLSHAMNYRWAGAGDNGWLYHYAGRLSGPLSGLGVQIFFVISGYIITSLLLREEARTGRISVAAFYARRVFRIMPPLLAYYVALLAARTSGEINFTNSSLLASVAFTCNTGRYDCEWWVAHTWSLATEEQFYLVWPLVFPLVRSAWRVPLIVVVLLMLAAAEAVLHPAAPSNYVSFGCIAAGVLMAVSDRARVLVGRASHPLLWFLSGVVMVLALLLPVLAPLAWVWPLLVVYLVFGGSRLPAVRFLLNLPPVQWIGLGSYSLYLWQQLFLADPALYRTAPPNVIFLPLVVLASVWLVERPFIRVGHRLSGRLKARSAADGPSG